MCDVCRGCEGDVCEGETLVSNVRVIIIIVICISNSSTLNFFHEKFIDINLYLVSSLHGKMIHINIKSFPHNSLSH